jgi:hypothetical protein
MVAGVAGGAIVLDLAVAGTGSGEAGRGLDAGRS